MLRKQYPSCLLFLLLSIVLFFSPGCKKKDDKPIILPVAPVADFTATPTVGAARLLVAFTDASTGNITSWEWDFDNDTVIDVTTKDATHLYDTPGTYTVTLTVTASDGTDSETKTNFITVNDVVTYVWTKTFGGPDYLYAEAVVVDEAGNIYVTGSFSGKMDFGEDLGTSDIKTATGWGNSYVMKVNSDGSYGWTRIMGGADTSLGNSIATDGSGNVYVTGRFNQTVDFGTDFGVSDSKTSAGEFDIYITKINADGSYGWTHAMGNAMYDEGCGVVTDISGNVYVTGRLEQAVDFGADFGTSDSKTSAGEFDIYITKINADGSYGWTKVMGGTTWDVGMGIATDISGNVYVTGQFGETVDFGTDFGTSDSKTAGGDGESDIFVTKINFDSSYGWTRVMGNSLFEYGNAAVTDSLGNVYVTGRFNGTLDFGMDFGASDDKTANGGSDVFITKISSDGDYIWTRVMGGASDDLARDITTDGVDNIYVTGYFRDTLDFGLDFAISDSKTSAGGIDIFVTKINSDSSYGWTRTIGGLGTDLGNGIATDGSGNVYVGGVVR